ncbi:dnaJ homolog subfamily C member 3-like [Palaemon carinicauda]|uniref:dnaJ homolog subfamily C member 3-like n=1 Tax=Palaemon carinicauda TaxID=392227 RepID=UPI0035B5CC4D
MIGNYNWPQDADSVIQERNAACEDMMLNLQGQLETLRESSIFKWFSWLLPEAPCFGDCPAVASQLRGCEGLRQMEEEALRFNDQVNSRWFFSKLLPKFDIRAREGNKGIYFGLAAAAGAIFGGIIYAMKRRDKEEQINELRRVIDEMNAEKEKQEELIAQKETEYQELKTQKETECQNLIKEKEILNKEMEEVKKNLNEKIEKQQNDCVQKDVHIKEQDELLEILKNENAHLRFFRAEANAASENPPDTDIISDCCHAIENGLEGCRAYMLRGKHLLKLGLFDAAMKDFEAARTVEESEECLRFIEDAKAQKKKWESKSHYEVLGVSKTATRAEILKAFKDLAFKLHPDKHGDQPKILQEAFEEKLKNVVNAKTVLTDEERRKKYDAEIQRPRLRQQPAQREPRQQYQYYYNPAKAYYNQRKPKQPNPQKPKQPNPQKPKHQGAQKPKKKGLKGMFAKLGKFFAGK